MTTNRCKGARDDQGVYIDRRCPIFWKPHRYMWFPESKRRWGVGVTFSVDLEIGGIRGLAPATTRDTATNRCNGARDDHDVYISRRCRMLSQLLQYMRFPGSKGRWADGVECNENLEIGGIRDRAPATTRRSVITNQCKAARDDRGVVVLVRVGNRRTVEGGGGSR